MKTLLTISFLTCAMAAQDADSKTVQLINSEGKAIGSATITPAGKGVNIRLRVQDLSPGQHAFHVHQTSSCQTPDFKSAGPHFNPTNKKHGFKNKEGHHAGDMKNFNVPA